MWFLAEDSLSREVTPDHDEPTVKAPKGATIDEQLVALKTPAFYAIADLADYIVKCELATHGSCFASNGLGSYRFVSDDGFRRLKAEHPDIWESFRLGEIATAALPDSDDTLAK